jgi:hypothetical protein
VRPWRKSYVEASKEERPGAYPQQSGPARVSDHTKCGGERRGTIPPSGTSRSKSWRLAERGGEPVWLFASSLDTDSLVARSELGRRRTAPRLRSFFNLEPSILHAPARDHLYLKIYCSHAASAHRILRREVRAGTHGLAVRFPG